jgi:hypothetical protein
VGQAEPLNRLVCRELFRVGSTEACRVVEAAAGSLIVARRPLPVSVRRPLARFRWGRGRRGGDRRAAGDGLADRNASARMRGMKTLWIGIQRGLDSMLMHFIQQAVYCTTE